MKKIKIKYCLIIGVSLFLAVAVSLIVYFNRSVVVHQISGKNIKIATEMLDKAGIKTKTVYEYSDTVPAGNVISCYPGVGSSVSKGQEVTLVISKGPSGNSGTTSGGDQ